MKKSKFYGLRGTSLNVAIAVIAGVDFALFGYDQVRGPSTPLPTRFSAFPSHCAKARKLTLLRQGVMGGLLTLPSFLQYFPQVDTEHPPPGYTASQASNVQGITVGAYTLGCFFGAVATIWLGNLLGRKNSIMLGSAIMVAGAAIQTASFSLPQLIVSRLITGFGNGQYEQKPNTRMTTQRLPY